MQGRFAGDTHLIQCLTKALALTWVRLGIFIQEGGGVDWNLLHLASPVAMGQAAWEWASLP